MTTTERSKPTEGGERAELVRELRQYATLQHHYSAINDALSRAAALLAADDKAGGEVAVVSYHSNRKFSGGYRHEFYSPTPVELGTKLYTRLQPQAEYIIEAEWPDRFGVPLEITNITDLGGGKIGIRVKPHESRASILAERPAVRHPLTDEAKGFLVMEYLGPAALTGGTMSVYDAFLLGIAAGEAAHGITGKAAA